MILGEITLVVLAGIVVAGLVVGSAVRAKNRTQIGPELVHAMRLLDRVNSCDDAIPQLPASLKEEMTKTLRAYYKEIEA